VPTRDIEVAVGVVLTEGEHPGRNTPEHFYGARA
jgi:hypothetical protein